MHRDSVYQYGIHNYYLFGLQTARMTAKNGPFYTDYKVSDVDPYGPVNCFCSRYGG